MSEIKEKVKNLPSCPGVYLMKDRNGNIIYVGKAKNLKRRVQTYFQHSQAHSQKTIKLKNNINDFDYLLTDTEFEAFMLECKLIKEIKPFFNKKMKNPQSYTFITIRMDDRLPRLEAVNIPIPNKQTLIFGPYINKRTAEKAILGLKEFYKIHCHNHSNRKTACLNYSLGLCIGVCFDDSAAEQYRHIIHKIIQLLNGTDRGVLDEMKKAMIEASENLDFTAATKYRDYIEALNALINKEKVIEFAEADNNIAILEYLTDRSFKLFLIKRNNLLSSETFSLENDDLVTAIKMNMIHHFKQKRLSSPVKISKEEIDEAQIIYSYLKSGACSFKIIPEEWLQFDHVKLDGAIKQLMGQPAAIK